MSISLARMLRRKRSQARQLMTMASQAELQERKVTCCGVMSPCRANFWAKFPFWRGAVRGEVLGEVCREVFHEVFGLVLLKHSEQKKTSAKTSAQNSHDSAQQNWRNFREKLHDEVLQGDPCQHLLWSYVRDALRTVKMTDWTWEAAGLGN